MIIGLGDELESTHDLLLEVDPLRDGEVELRLWKVDQHACDLWSLDIAHKLLDVLVDEVADHLLLVLLLGSFELRGHEHVLDFIKVRLRVDVVHELRSSGRHRGGARDHALVHQLVWRRSNLLLRNVVGGTHGVVSHATTHVATITVVGTLEVGPVILVAIPLLLTKLVWHGGHLSATTHGSVPSKAVVHGARPILIPSILVELEGRLQEKSQEVNEVLGTIKTSNLSLSLLVLLSILSPLVEDLLISDLPHLLGVAVFNIESIIALEEDILRKLFGQLALVLLLKVDEGLSGSRDNLEFVWAITLSCRVEVDSKLFLCGTEWEVLDKQTEVHDGFLVLEVVHLEFMNSHRLLFSLSHVKF